MAKRIARWQPNNPLWHLCELAIRWPPLQPSMFPISVPRIQVLLITPAASPLLPSTPATLLLATSLHSAMNNCSSLKSKVPKHTQQRPCAAHATITNKPSFQSMPTCCFLKYMFLRAVPTLSNILAHLRFCYVISLLPFIFTYSLAFSIKDLWQSICHKISPGICSPSSYGMWHVFRHSWIAVYLKSCFFFFLIAICHCLHCYVPLTLPYLTSIWHLLCLLVGGACPGILADIRLGILFASFPAILSGSLSGIPTQIYRVNIVFDFCSWRSMWHSLWHFSGHVLWHSICRRISTFFCLQSGNLSHEHRDMLFFWQNIPLSRSFYHFMWHSTWRSVSHLISHLFVPCIYLVFYQNQNFNILSWNTFSIFDSHKHFFSHTVKKCAPYFLTHVLSSNILSIDFIWHKLRGSARPQAAASRWCVRARRCLERHRARKFQRPSYRKYKPMFHRRGITSCSASWLTLSKKICSLCHPQLYIPFGKHSASDEPSQPWTVGNQMSHLHKITFPAASLAFLPTFSCSTS